MNAEVRDYWRRAQTTIETAAALAASDPDSAVSRAYYAAFYAVSALFLLEGRAFTRHATLENAVHRDLVKAGRWDVALGAAFSALLVLRDVGDYGGSRHATSEDARGAVENARRILAAVTRDAGERLNAFGSIENGE